MDIYLVALCNTMIKGIIFNFQHYFVNVSVRVSQK